MAELPDVIAKLQVGDERFPPDGMEMKTTKMTETDSGCFSRAESSDVETDAVPSNEDIRKVLQVRDQLLGVTQEMSEKFTKEDIELEDMDLAKCHISDHQAKQKPPVAPCKPLSDIVEITSASLVTHPKKQKNAARFLSQQAPSKMTFPPSPTPSQETNTTSEHDCQAHVSSSASPVSEDVTPAQPNSQPATHQNKLNIAAAAMSSQQPSQTAKLYTATSPHTPTQETVALKAETSFSSSATWEDEYFDVLLLHSEHDMDHVEKFMEYAQRYSWKVTSPDEFPANVPKFNAFSSALHRSTFTILLLTDNFLSDCWCETQYQTALVQSIENPEKRFCVIPITCQDKFKMPTELSPLTGVKMRDGNCEKKLKRSISVDKRVKLEKKAASVVQGDSKVEAADLSLDELYKRNRPELNPGQCASHVFHSDESFRQICVILDKKDPLGRDWRLVAEQLGFQASSIDTLKSEKSPAAQILECFCQQNTGKSRKDILEILHKILVDIQRADVLEIWTRILVAEAS